MRKTQIPMNKPVYLGLSTLNLSKTVIYELYKKVVKRKFKNKGYKNCLNTIQLENKINHLEKK